MTKTGKLVLGAITVGAPLVLAMAAVAGYICIRRAIATHTHPVCIGWLGLTTLLSALVCIGLFAFYARHSRKCSWIASDKRSYWLGILWAFNIFVYPIYWYRFIWKDE